VKAFDVERVEDRPEILRHEEERLCWLGFSRCDPREDDVPRDSDAHFWTNQIQKFEVEMEGDRPSQPTSSLTLSRMDSA